MSGDLGRVTSVKQQYSMARLNELEQKARAIFQEHLPESFEKDQAIIRFSESLMWAGASLNKLSDVVEVPPRN